MLLGRDRECARLDTLITQVQEGSSAVLRLSGEAGIGKTSLLDYAATHSNGLRVLRASGIKSEGNLPFAGLSDLLRPVIGHLDALPGTQRTALAAALAIGPAVSADRFAICTATLSLLGEAAVQRPVLAVVDDVHWVDAASSQVLEFIARRLSHDAIGLVIALRTGVPCSFDAARMNTMAVTGLEGTAARELLARTSRSIAPAVAGRLVSDTGGNPLALLEVTGALTDDELTGLASLPEPLPVATALQHAFAHRLDATGFATRQLLLLAACDARADLATLQWASRLLGLGLADLALAERVGLVRLTRGTVEFTHPLLRSAAYHTAEPQAR